MDSSDRLVRAIDRERNVRIATTITTDLVGDAARRHQLSPAATIAVGRALTAGVLLATLTKGNERVTVQIRGDGPLGAITVDATGSGDVRGYALHGAATVELGSQRRIAELVGRVGVVNVVRDLGLKELYQGQVPLLTGEVDEDIEAYLRASEQIPSALGCEVLLDDGGRTFAAAGILIQVLPGGDADTVREAQHAFRTGLLHEALRHGVTPARELAQRMYTAGPIEFVDSDRGVRFQCRCSAERIGEMLALLGTVDLDEMIADGKPAEVVCNFCNAKYQVDRPELERIRAAVAARVREKN